MIPLRSSSVARATPRILYLSVLAALAACSDGHGPSSPPANVLEGPYAATTFTAATDDTTFDLLTEGIGLTLDLQADGSTTGSFRVPDMPRNLEGTWDTSAARLHLHEPAAPEFLNQLAFEIGPHDLQGEVTIQPFTFRLILTKQAAP